MSDSKTSLDLFRSYLAVIENSVGSRMFRNIYMRRNGESVDILNNGELSCAVFVTSVLNVFRSYGLIEDAHATVASTLADLERSGWRKIPEPRKGAIALWEDAEEAGELHQHIGFYIDEDKAVSNSTSTGEIAAHHPAYGVDENGNAKRKVLAYYWNDKLDS